MTKRLDVVVIGGGPAGSATATRLAQLGRSVGVVESAAFPRKKVCGEFLSATSFDLLDRLGVGDAFRAAAGPEVRRVGLFAGRGTYTAEVPPGASAPFWGRALGRESLDTALLASAARAGVAVFQPATVTALRRDGPAFIVEIDSAGNRETRLAAGMVVAAHGSWGVGPLPTQRSRHRPRPDDLLAFKNHFRSASLPADLMPLLAFPGGYGGMVTCDGARVSTSFCIRRDRLARLREAGEPAGEAVLRAVRAWCQGVDEALTGASADGPWHAAGPIRPGVRVGPTDPVARVGNAAGEAHPAVAEGISMALQGGWLLATQLAADGRFDPARYARTWRQAFGPRILASAAIAHWAMRPAAVAVAAPVLRRVPAVLTWGARLSGKVARIVRT